MASSTKQTSSNTSSNTVDPTQMARDVANYNNVQSNGASFTSPYTGNLTAGFTPAQVQAQGILSGVATDPQYAANSANATGAVNGILNAPSMNTTVTAQPVNASTIAGTDLSPYMNPYQSDVINSTMTQLGQQRSQAMNGDTQAAIAANAFGNNRLGVNQALTNQYYDQDAASTLAGLNSANFTQAQNAAGTDAATKNAVGEFNSGQNVTAQQNSIGNAQNEQGILNNTATNLSNLNTAALNNAANQGGILGNVGQQQQTQAQNALTAAYNNWLQGKNLTLDEQQMLNQALSVIPTQQTTNSNGTSTTTSNPGAAGILGSIGGLAMAAAMPGTGSLLSGLFGPSAAAASGIPGVNSFTSNSYVAG